MTPSYIGVYRIDFEDSTTTRLYLNNILITTTLDISVSNLNVMVGLGANDRVITIKNLKIKPL